MKYSLDTSALLDGWRRHYAPDVFPGVWQRLDELIHDGHLRASEEVFQEVRKKDDEVTKWVKERRKVLFVEADDELQTALRRIMRDYPKLVDTRAGRSAADPFVIALAQITECAVVTGERPTHSPNRPNIPDVCRAISVECISLLELLRREGWTFHSES
jgi:hypothetical protein